MSLKIRKAVIPAAGLGTRFLPATKAIPKEMIPIIDVPMIQYIIEEAIQSGIRDIILITARHKHSIEDHFDHNFELEKSLDEKNKQNLSQISKGLARFCNIIAIRQKNPLGLGHAVLCAEHAVGQEPFAVLLGDDLIDSPNPCTKQLIDIYDKQQASVVGVMKIEKTDVTKYGMVGGVQLTDKLMHVDRLAEKPKLGTEPSLLAIPGRYILVPQIFDYIRATQPGAGGEIQLTDALQMLAQKEKLFAYLFEGKRYDTGDRLGYLEATLAFGLKREDVGPGLKKMILKYAALWAEKSH